MKFLASSFITTLFVPGIDAGSSFCTTDTRRLLSKLEDDGWVGILQSCSDVEYETSLFVDEHVFVISTPVLKHNDSDCPSVAMEQSDRLAKPTDADFGIRTVNIHNVTLARDLPGLPIGTFPLSEIANAFHTVQAEAASDPDSMKNYDSILQNCGDFPAHMLTLLNVAFDHQMVQFIAKQLQKRHPTFVQNVRNSPNAMKLLANKTTLDELTDLQLLELLVESRAKHLYSPSTAPLSDRYEDSTMMSRS